MNRSPTRYDFCGGAKAIQHSLNVALVIAEMDKIAQSRPIIKPTKMDFYKFNKIKAGREEGIDVHCQKSGIKK